ncbi:hypothetical protein [Mycobacterium sp.]
MPDVFSLRPAHNPPEAERYPAFAEYQRKTSRTIPVVALTPTGGAKPRE